MPTLVQRTFNPVETQWVILAFDLLTLVWMLRPPMPRAFFSSTYYPIVSGAGDSPNLASHAALLNSQQTCGSRQMIWVQCIKDLYLRSASGRQGAAIGTRRSEGSPGVSRPYSRSTGSGDGPARVRRLAAGGPDCIQTGVNPGGLCGYDGRRPHWGEQSQDEVVPRGSGGECSHGSGTTASNR